MTINNKEDDKKLINENQSTDENHTIREEIIEEIEKLRKVIKFVDDRYLYYFETYYFYYYDYANLIPEGIDVEDFLYDADLLSLVDNYIVEQSTERIKFKLRKEIGNLDNLLFGELEKDEKKLFDILKRLREIINFISDLDLRYFVETPRIDEEGNKDYYIAFDLLQEVKNNLGIVYSEAIQHILSQPSEIEAVTSTDEEQTIEYRYENYDNRTRKELIREIEKLIKVIQFIESKDLYYYDIDEDLDGDLILMETWFYFKDRIADTESIRLKDIYELDLNNLSQERLLKLLKMIREIIRRAECELYCEGKPFIISQEVKDNFGLTLKKKPHPEKRK